MIRMAFYYWASPTVSLGVSDFTDVSCSQLFYHFIIYPLFILNRSKPPYWVYLLVLPALAFCRHVFYDSLNYVLIHLSLLSR